jgi:hypothetical protein
MPIKINDDNKNKLVPELTRAEYLAGIASFNRFFREKINISPIGTILLVPWASFESTVETKRRDLGITPERTVVAFFHGLDENKKVRTGFSVFGVENDIAEGIEIDIIVPAAAQRDTPEFEIIEDEISGSVMYNGANRRKQMIRSTQRPWNYSGLYFRNVQVHRAPIDSPTPIFSNVNPLEDSKMVLFPWKREIMVLERSNRVSSKTPYLIISDYTSFIIDNVTRVRVAGVDGYYHSKAMHIGNLDTSNVITDELNIGNSVLVVNFQGKALDYGNMCPPLCDRVRF